MNRIKVMVLGVLAAAMLAGCAQKEWSADELIRAISGPSRKEIALQALNPDDPDARRRATLEMSDHDWGLEDPYTRIYVLQTQDESPQVRSAAMTALGRTGDPNYIGDILEGLNDRDDQVRIDAATALDRVQGLEAIEPLKQHAANDSNYHVQCASIRALRHYRRTDVLDSIILLLDDPQFGVRYHARSVLQEMTGEDCGYDSDCWRATLAEKDDMFAPPPEPGKPWWDLLGVTGG